ncbi:MAG: hypothetical protein PVH68_16250 [Armatimonadota bacterium]|jgi:hypothetical protein
MARRAVWASAAALACAAAAYGAFVAPATEPSADPGRAGPRVQLRYEWARGEAARVRTRVEGRGTVREAGVEHSMTMSANLVAREQVTGVGAGGDATVTTIWESATFNINGRVATFAPETARLDKRVGQSGKVYWRQERGRDRAAREGPGAFTVDTRQLAVLDFLVQQVQYLRLPAAPVALDEKWGDMEQVDMPDLRGYMQKISQLTALRGGAEEGTCAIRSSLTAPLELALAPGADELVLRGKATGNMAHNFDYRRGRLNSASGTLSLDLRARMPGEPPPPPPMAPPEPSMEGASVADEADDTAPFMLRMQFEVRVEREHGVSTGE